MKTKRLPKLKRWERELAKTRGRDEAAIFLARAQARYDELLSRARRYEKKALRFHFEDNLLPAIAAYSVLLMDGMDRDAAGDALDSLLEAGLESERRMYRFWGRFPFFFDMLRAALRPMMDAQFPEGWNVEWIEPSRDLVGLNCRACFYLDRLTEYGFPELTPHFCRLDDLLAAEAAPAIRFERTQTIGRGGTMCDFRYARVRR
jgi:hypothetical protein